MSNRSNTTPKVDSSNSENEKLKKELSELKNTVNDLLTALSMGTKQEVVTPQETDKSKDELKGEDYVKVMSLIFMPLNLSTRGVGQGQGKVFKFTEFGQVKLILYSDLIGIIETHQSFLEAGYFYIMDNRVIRRHGLDEIYSKILTKEKIESVLTGKKDVAISLYKEATERQKEIINDVIIRKLVNQEEVDLNMVDAISRIGNIAIMDKVRMSKEYVEEEVVVE